MQKVIVPILATLLVLAAMFVLKLSPTPVVCEAPRIELCELPGFTSVAGEITKAEIDTLPADTRILRRLYTDYLGYTYVVSVVIGGTSKSSIHRPELCLPSQGKQLMVDPRTVQVGADSWRVITLQNSSSFYTNYFAYTFFNQAGFRTSSHLSRIFRDVWDRSVHNRIDRWVMVTVLSDCPREEMFRQFLRNLKEFEQ